MPPLPPSLRLLIPRTHHHSLHLLRRTHPRNLTNLTRPLYKSTYNPNPQQPLPQPPHHPHRTLTTTPPHPLALTPLTDPTYHALSDAYIETLVTHLEELQESREDVDVEYSAGVLTLTYPPAGIYVLNKQPPNRQIWLSSPVSGPKRYDWVADEGFGDGEGEWVYLRDGSTLSALFEEEVGVEMGGKEG